MDSVINKDETISFDLISHDGEPMKPSRKKTRDSYMYRGALEDNVTPVIAPSFYGMESEDHIALHLDVTPG